MSEEQAAQQFAIQKVYLKDFSFESPNSPAVFQDEGWSPELNVQVNTEARSLDATNFEVVLSVTVEATKDEKTLFLAEVKEAGIFTLANFSDEEKGGMLGAFCPNILFPYAREAVSSAVVQGGFPQLLLAPINFDALYQQHLQQNQAGQDAAAPATETLN